MGKRRLTLARRVWHTGKEVPEYQRTSAARPPQARELLDALPFGPEAFGELLHGQNSYSMPCGIHRHLLFLVRITTTSLPNRTLTRCQNKLAGLNNVDTQKRVCPWHPLARPACWIESYRSFHA